MSSAHTCCKLLKKSKNTNKLFKEQSASVHFSGGCKSLMRGVVSEALASGKVVWGDPCTEGSQTAKSGTDEQKRHMRLRGGDKQAHHCNVHFTNHHAVDVAGIGGRKKLLPGEVLRCRVHRKKSAGAIVTGSNEPRTETVEDSHAGEGPNITTFQMQQGGEPALL